MIIILTGAPGAGKGTQADLIAERLGYKKISTGDALRRHIKDGTPIGKQAQGYMSEGKLVPDSVLLGILQSELEAARGRHVLLDGYPRNVSQAKALQAIVGEKGIAAVIHLDVDKELLVQRISGRRTCMNCGASFHTLSSPPKRAGVCDRCSSELVQRPDDHEEKVKVRLDVYVRETSPILDFYKAAGLYHRVEGGGSTEEVYAAVSPLLPSKNSWED